jgi:hypothetical protein
MADKSLSNERTAGTILADSNQARSKFGFAGEHGSPITSAPKMSDMWFIEVIKTDGQRADVSSFAKSVSPITVTTDVASIDKYGKRVHVPTYISFPEVQVSFYDKTDGSGFVFSEEIYKNFFKNGSLSAESNSVDDSIQSINSGRKLPSNAEGSGYYRSFQKIVIYHFFGSFSGSGSSTGIDPRGQDQRGIVNETVSNNNSASIQKIELINPLVTNISFSGSDYSDSSLRTIDISLQPENVIFGTPTESPAVPEWMKQGLEYILEDLNPTDSVKRARQLLSTIQTNKRLDALVTDLAGGNVFTTLENTDATRTDIEWIDGGTNTRGLNTDASRADIKWIDGGTDPRGLNQRGNSTELMGTNTDASAREQLNRLKRLSGTLKYVDSNPDATAEEKEQALQLFTDEIASAMPMPASALKQPDYFGEMQSTWQLESAANPSNRFPDNPYSSDILYPNVAGFSDARLQSGGTDRFTGVDLGNLISNELITSFMNGKPINLSNITSAAAQGILGGNTGIATLQNLGKTSQSKFGIAGDFVRDGLLQATRTGVNTSGPRTTIISTAPISSPTPAMSDFTDKDINRSGVQFDANSRTSTQNNIANLRNITRGKSR